MMIGYVRNNRERMDYPRDRQLGLPISRAPVESTIKQINRRLKGERQVPAVRRCGGHRASACGLPEPGWACREVLVGRAEAVLSAPDVLVASLPGLRNNGNGPATACPAVPEGVDSLNPRVVRVKA
jgi:hypothetical protein